MQDTDLSLITTDNVLLPLFREKKITVSVLRLDTIHPLISGNKYFKLLRYLEEAKQLGKTNIVTFGGAWSNHIVATAAASKQYHFNCTGIIRGEEARSLSSTLLQARQLGMKLVFLSREEYTLQKRNTELSNDTDYFISEGGFGIKGAEGAATIADHYDAGLYSHICCAAGTGTMTAGLLLRAPSHQQVLCFS
ncbi:MAG: pyridoxal-phosphate dependent enzyme, partial [Chitinophagaceae bacterium]